MIDAKDAVAAATRYMKDIYGTQIEGLNVEEIELRPESMTWHVTMGYWEFLPQPPLETFNVLAPRKVRRAYKDLTIGADDGGVKSMKIKVVPAQSQS